MRRRRRIVLLAAAGFAVVGAGCGSEEFANDPRPPAPVELTASVTDKRVLVSPIEIDGAPVGGGLANITISNQTDAEQQLTFIGPNDGRTDPIVPNGVTEYKINLEEGEYVVSADDASIDEMAFTVGPERPSAQNDLLLP